MKSKTFIRRAAGGVGAFPLLLTGSAISQCYCGLVGLNNNLGQITCRDVSFPIMMSWNILSVETAPGLRVTQICQSKHITPNKGRCAVGFRVFSSLTTVLSQTASKYPHLLDTVLLVLVLVSVLIILRPQQRVLRY